MVGKGEGFSLISEGDTPRPSTVLKIFQDAAKLFWRSWKPMLSISLIFFLPYALLFSGGYLVLGPLIIDMFNKFFKMRTEDRRSLQYHMLLKAIMKDIREITEAEVAIALFSFLSLCFLLMATVHTVAMASQGEQATFKGLFYRIRRTWKGPVVTELYVAVINAGYTALSFLVIGAFAVVSNGSSVVSALGAVIAILALLLLVYLEMTWYEGLVISVVEEGCYGLAALGKASQLIGGRMRLGFRVNLLLHLITVIFYVAFYFVNIHLPPGNIHLLCGLVAVYASLLIREFMLSAYVVFYYECKKRHGEEVAMKESLVYTSVPTASALDGALP